MKPKCMVRSLTGNFERKIITMPNFMCGQLTTIQLVEETLPLFEAERALTEIVRVKNHG